MASLKQLRGFEYEVVAFDVTASGDNTIRDAVAAKHIVVVGYVLVTIGAVEAKWRTGTITSTDITGALTGSQNNRAVDRDQEYGCFWTKASEALKLNLSAAVRAHGYVLLVVADSMPDVIVV